MKWNNEEKPMKKNVIKWNGNVLIRYSRKKILLLSSNYGIFIYFYLYKI